MPCQVLIAATTHRKQIKGQMHAARNLPVTWGTQEVPPAYVILEISNASADQVKPFITPWKTDFQYSTITNPDNSIQITASISQNWLDTFGAIHGFKLTMKNYLIDEWAATIIDWDPLTSTVIFDVPEGTDLPELKRDVIDKFEEQIGPRWLFAEADVDIALGLGGTVELTKAQALSKIIDRAAP